MFYQEFSEYLQQILTKEGKPIICGDFNIHVENPDDQASKKFMEICASKGFVQHNNFATHGDSILDLVLTCDALCDHVPIKDLHVIGESPSDHSLVCFNVPKIEYQSSNKGTTTTLKEIRRLSEIDINKFRNDITEQMPTAKDLTSLDDAVKAYENVLTSILDKHAPNQTVLFREGKHPW